MLHLALSAKEKFDNNKYDKSSTKVQDKFSGGCQAGHSISSIEQNPKNAPQSEG